MKLKDIIWEDIEASDKKVLRIINHKSFQRLKKIWISGFGYLFDLKRNSTRFEHSIGVWKLLKEFGASEKECIAGLIHDISHTAFSHLSTYAIQGKYKGKEWHELQKEKFMKESGLFELLEELGFDPYFLIEEKNFPLLENSLPDICADRIDYTLRDSLHLQILNFQEVKKVLSGLGIKDKSFVFLNKESAFIYSFAFYLLNLQHYGSALEAHFNKHFGEIIKIAIEKGILSDSDWFSDDEKVFLKLKNSGDKEVLSRIKKYNRKLVVFEDFEKPKEIIPKKIRIVDPKVLIDGKLKRLSKVDEVYSQILSKYKETHKEHKLPVRYFWRS